MKLNKCVIVVAVLVAATKTGAKEANISAGCSTENVEKNSERKLKEQLFCEYEVDRRPVVNNSRPLDVGMLLVVVGITAPEEGLGLKTRIIMHATIVLTWTDDNFKWANDYKYGESDMLWVPSDKLWKPNIVLLASDGMRRMVETSVKCAIKENGEIKCFYNAEVKIDCDAKYKYWPLSTMNCSLNISPWTQSYAINLIHHDRNDSIIMVDLDMISRQHNWKVRDFGTGKISVAGPTINETFPSVEYYFVLSKCTTTKLALIIGPLLSIVSLTLASYVLVAGSTDRIVLLAASLFCHFVFTLQLTHYIPTTRDLCPRLVLLVRGSIILTILAFVQTLLLRMAERGMFASFFNTFEVISHTCFGRILIPGTFQQMDSGILTDDDDAENMKKRQLTVLMMNRLLLTSVLLTYIGLFLFMFV